QMNLAAQQASQLAADSQAETGAAVFAAGSCVRLLKRFEDQFLLFQRDADAAIGDFKGNDRRRLIEDRMIAAPASHGGGDFQLDAAFRRKLESVGEEVFQNLLQTFGVGDDAAPEVRIDI